jgi:hypothetical protein
LLLVVLLSTVGFLLLAVDAFRRENGYQLLVAAAADVLVAAYNIAYVVRYLDDRMSISAYIFALFHPFLFSAAISCFLDGKN